MDPLVIMLFSQFQEGITTKSAWNTGAGILHGRTHSRFN